MSWRSLVLKKQTQSVNLSRCNNTCKDSNKWLANPSAALINDLIDQTDKLFRSLSCWRAGLKRHESSSGKKVKCMKFCVVVFQRLKREKEWERRFHSDSDQGDVGGDEAPTGNMNRGELTAATRCQSISSSICPSAACLSVLVVSMVTSLYPRNECHLYRPSDLRTIFWASL